MYKIKIIIFFNQKTICNLNDEIQWVSTIDMVDNWKTNIEEEST